jgi:hypothetical protein
MSHTRRAWEIDCDWLARVLTGRGDDAGLLAGQADDLAQSRLRGNCGIQARRTNDQSNGGVRRISNVGLSIILCATMAPSIACATTYRMIIQSHPDVGGKCIDVPNHQFVREMRVQMWDCNNTVAQTFSYDETSQQLTIGNLCVDSWGRGDPQDAVGLGSCSGQANQHWKIVASKDYYQIMGMNNRCLELRYAIKDNGAPLDIQDCDAGRPYRLWALVEAPPADALGHVWDETEGGWKGVWTRRGDTNVFDAAFAHPDGRKVTTVNSVTLNGNSITIKRTKSSDDNLCTYTGILVGASLSGTYECIGHSPGRWQVTIR